MNISVFGSGTWGTALAQVAADNGHKVIVYGNKQSQIDDINNNHKNSFYFGDDVELSSIIRGTTVLEEAVTDSDIIILSVPTFAMREVLRQIRPYLGNRKRIFINTAKGFELGSRLTMTSLIKEIIPATHRYPIVSLIGPSHAEEVVRRNLTCITATCEDINVGKTIADLMSNHYFRVYTNTDVVGAEIGVAMKNAIALASGIIEGLNYGDNARAALVTRGLAEMVRFGVAHGGKAETYLGLTGIGDLMVTCYSFHSRNFQVGYEIGKANSAKEAIKNNEKTVEGVNTVKAIYEMSLKENIELPIIYCLHLILFEDKKPSEVVHYLMSRPLKKE